jgi:hypothetical protein
VGLARGRTRLLVVCSLLLVAALALPSGAAAAPVARTSEFSFTTGDAYVARYGMSLYFKGAFVSQVNSSSCVGAAVQIMRNLVQKASDHSRSRQLRYWRYAREHNRYRYDSNGSDPAGWEAALDRWVGRYKTVRSRTYALAIRGAVKQMRRTRKPVGLLVGNGTHAWVLVGFTTTTDPLRTEDYRIKTVRVVGPLWPRRPVGRGYDRQPNTSISGRDMARFLTPYRERFPTIWSGWFVTIRPEG